MKRSFLLALAAALLLAAPALAQEAPAQDVPPAERKAPWDSSVVKEFQRLPVQDLGRIKPLDTVAGFKLLKLHGTRSLKTPYGETLAPIPWLLDVLFFPDQAAHYDVFIVQDSDVIDSIGIARGTKGKRDRYSFADLEPGLAKLEELGQQYSKMKEGERSGLQDQVVQLLHNVFEYEELSHFLDFAREKYPYRASPELEAVFSPQDQGLAVFLAKADAIKAAINKAGASRQPAFRPLFDELQLQAGRARGLILFPPTKSEDREWMSPGQLFEKRFETGQPFERQVATLGALEQLERVKNDPAAFKATAEIFTGACEKLADERGEYSKVPLEVAFYKADFFYNALLLFGFSFMLVALSWLWPAKLLKKGSIALLALGAVFLVSGIVCRCIIRSRPPVSTLYETILFISAVAVIVSSVIEVINRQGIAIAISPLLGTLGMFLSIKYEFKDAVSNGDTMTSLLAVLDTNFWLSTHVTSVTTGYSAGLLAAAIAHVWLIGKVTGYRKDDDRFYKNIARMTYGVLCFGLLFSTVGTILGGIWANYSWGRFWGWDPKENGALLIVLWELIILHARMGGYVRDFGLSILAVLGGLVIAFSWWGVNLLGVGLHSYGFTSGIFTILAVLYGIELLLVLLASGWWLAMRNQVAPSPALAPSPQLQQPLPSADAAKPADPSPSPAS
jgi:ABC-type transport system involved in cytochrome c biogenesis permease subunit